MAEELTKLIERTEPSVLEHLRAAHPVRRDIFGGAIDRSIDAESAKKDDEKLRAARLDLLTKGLSPLRQELESILDIIRNKMKRVQRTKLIGAIIASLSGIALALAVQFGFEGWKEVVTAAFATIGGLTVILTDYFQAAPSGHRIASAEEYGKLTQVSSEVQKLETRVEQASLFPLGDEDIKMMIESMNDYAVDINHLVVG